MEHLSFSQAANAFTSISRNKKIDFDTGEGISWWYLTEDEIKDMKKQQRIQRKRCKWVNQ